MKGDGGSLIERDETDSWREDRAKGRERENGRMRKRNVRKKDKREEKKRVVVKGDEGCLIEGHETDSWGEDQERERTGERENKM